MKRHIGIDIDFRGGIAGIGPDGTVIHHPVLVQELGNDRFLDVDGNQGILDSFAAHFDAAKDEVFVAYEQSRKNPKFGTIGNYVMGKNGEFWRVLNRPLARFGPANVWPMATCWLLRADR